MKQDFMNETNWAMFEEPRRRIDEPYEMVLHVIPFGDKEEHVVSYRCWCQPFLDHKDKKTGAEYVIHKKISEMIN